MPRFDESSGECQVLTFRDGLLQAVGHDLKLRFGAFTLETSDDGSRVSGTFDVRTLRVVNAMKGLVEDKTALSASDKRSIDETIAKQVLKVAEHPTATFRSIEVNHTEAGVHIDGELTLCGARKRVACLVRRAGEFLNTDISLYQPDFGITPYTAMMGALKVKPHVTVRVALSAR